jgi:hypothetical protein
LLDDLGDRRGYSHLKEEALDRIKWRNRFGRGCGPVVCVTLLMNEQVVPSLYPIWSYCNACQETKEMYDILKEDTLLKMKFGKGQLQDTWMFISSQFIFKITLHFQQTLQNINKFALSMLPITNLHHFLDLQE